MNSNSNHTYTQKAKKIARHNEELRRLGALKPLLRVKHSQMLE